MQAVQANAEMDRILTLLAVQERLGLAEEGPLPPRALAEAAIQARPKPAVICRWCQVSKGFRSVSPACAENMLGTGMEWFICCYAV